MAGLILVAIATVFMVHVQASTVEDTHYVAAVVDYTSPPVEAKLTPEENIMKNIEALGGFMAEAAKQEVDILVFPEEGLKGVSGTPYPMAVPGAEDNVTPCGAQGWPKPLSKLSCLAAEHSMYLVVNLVHQVPCTKAQDEKCPAVGYYNYNTNVVFDRKGKVIARYHKYNLFGELGNSVPPSVEYVTFDTDFGVRFGMFICFDILFDKPAAQLARVHNVTDFVFSADWFSEVPFLSAVQAHSGWAHALDVTLLSAAFNYPPGGATGSGIYRGRQGILAYVFNPRTESTMLVHRVPKHGHWDDSAPPLPAPDRLDPTSNYVSAATDPYDSVNTLRMIQDNFTMYNTILLPRPEPGQKQELADKVCNNDFCCTLSGQAMGLTLSPMRSAAVSVHGASSRARAAAAVAVEEASVEEAEDDVVDGLHYRLVAFSGVRDHSGVASTGVQVCGIISCRNEALSSCGWNVPRLNEPTVKWTEFLSLSLSAEYEREGTLQFASTQAGPRYDTLPVNKYDFTSSESGKEQQVSLALKGPVTDLRTFAIYGRKFAWDGLTPTGH